jgi:hypothetical protein
MADGPGAAGTALPSGCSFDVTRDASGFQLLGEAPISDEREDPYGIARGVALIAIILKATSLALILHPRDYDRWLGIDDKGADTLLLILVMITLLSIALLIVGTTATLVRWKDLDGGFSADPRANHGKRVDFVKMPSGCSALGNL